MLCFTAKKNIARIFLLLFLKRDSRHPPGCPSLLFVDLPHGHGHHGQLIFCQQLSSTMCCQCQRYFKQYNGTCSADLCQLLLSNRCSQCQSLALLVALAASGTAGSSAISISSQPLSAFYCFLFFRTEGFRKDTHKHQ